MEILDMDGDACWRFWTGRGGVAWRGVAWCGGCDDEKEGWSQILLAFTYC